MTSIEIRGTRLELHERGEGEPVLLVHGSASDHRTWAGPLESLSRRHRVIAYSRRYHWPNESIPDRRDYDMIEQLDDLQALIEARGLEPVHLVGHSYGGFLALLLAIRDPAKVRSLVLCEPPVITLFTSNQPTPKQLLRLLFTRPRTFLAIVKFGARGVAPATKALERGDRDAALEAFGEATLGRAHFRGLSPERLQQARDNFIAAELLGSGFAPLDAADVRRIERPALLLTGEKSPRLFHRLADRLEELLPRVKRVEIPDASHIMHEDNPAAFEDAVRSFVEAD